jgi:hypothetical protein
MSRYTHREPLSADIPTNPWEKQKFCHPERAFRIGCALCLRATINADASRMDLHLRIIESKCSELPVIRQEHGWTPQGANHNKGNSMQMPISAMGSPPHCSDGQVHPTARSKLPSHGIVQRILPLFRPAVLHLKPIWNAESITALALTHTLQSLRDRSSDRKADQAPPL